MRRVVALFVFTDVPGLGRVTVLQRRGDWDFEKNQGESYPGLCTALVQGDASDNENLSSALAREISEELGIEFLGKTVSQLFDKEDAMREIHRNEFRDPGHEKDVIFYGVFVPYESLRVIRLHPSAGGLRFLAAADLTKVGDRLNYDRNLGISDRMAIVLFEDARVALEKAFSLFGTP